MEVAEAIRTRRSIRKFQDQDVPTELILKAIGLACWAPNGGNYQSWKFIVVKNRDLIRRIADVVQSKTDLIASWPEAQEMAETVKRYQANASFFRSAPALIAVAMGEYRSAADKVLRRRGEGDPAAREMMENRAAISSRTQTIAGATAYLILALHDLGLASCWMAGPMLARREIHEMLGVPDDMGLFALVPVGYAAEKPEARPRKPMEEVVRIIE